MKQPLTDKNRPPRGLLRDLADSRARVWISASAALDSKRPALTQNVPCKLPAVEKAGGGLAALDRILSVLERAGTWGMALVSLLPGVGAYLWASLSRMPGPVAAVLAVYGVAGGLWLYTSLMELRWQRRRNELRPDYEKWNLVATFTFAQAANLWADRRPELSFDDSAEAIFRMLKEQAKAGRLDANAMGEDFDRDALVLRGDLVRLARRLKQRPKFLFNKGAR